MSVLKVLQNTTELDFSNETGYEQLDQRKRLTITKVEELLQVLEHRELPLHNNPAELAARTIVQRRKISYATQTELGTKAWDLRGRQEESKYYGQWASSKIPSQKN